MTLNGHYYILVKWSIVSCIYKTIDIRALMQRHLQELLSDVYIIVGGWLLLNQGVHTMISYYHFSTNWVFARITFTIKIFVNAHIHCRYIKICPHNWSLLALHLKFELQMPTNRFFWSEYFQKILYAIRLKKISWESFDIVRYGKPWYSYISD